jgi:hypothetical protein
MELQTSKRKVKMGKLKAEMGQTESQKGKRTQQTRKGETSSLSSPCDYALKSIFVLTSV